MYIYKHFDKFRNPTSEIININSSFRNKKSIDKVVRSLVIQEYKRKINTDMNNSLIKKVLILKNSLVDNNNRNVIKETPSYATKENNSPNCYHENKFQIKIHNNIASLNNISNSNNQLMHNNINNSRNDNNINCLNNYNINFENKDEQLRNNCHNNLPHLNNFVNNIKNCNSNDNNNNYNDNYNIKHKINNSEDAQKKQHTNDNLNHNPHNSILNRSLNSKLSILVGNIEGYSNENLSYLSYIWHDIICCKRINLNSKC